jgi:hypothetical protein
VYGYYVFPKASVPGFRTSFNPLPCHAWDGYMVTSVHRVEVEVGADGPASAPLSGAAAAAPPAGANCRISNMTFSNYEQVSSLDSRNRTHI